MLSSEATRIHLWRQPIDVRETRYRLPNKQICLSGGFLPAKRPTGSMAGPRRARGLGSYITGPISDIEFRRSWVEAVNLKHLGEAEGSNARCHLLFDLLMVVHQYVGYTACGNRL